MFEDVNLNQSKIPPPNAKNTSLVNKIFKKVYIPQLPSLKLKNDILPFLKNLVIPPKISRNIFGLDIGSSSIKLIQISHTKAGLDLTSLYVEELPRVTNPEEQKKIAKEVLKKIIRTNNIQGKIVCSLPVDAVNIQTVKIPSMPEEEIMKALRWEAQSELSIDVENTVMDYIVLSEIVKAGTKQLEILLVTTPKSIVSELVKTISELGVIPFAFEPPPLAVVEAFGQDELKKHGHIVGLLELAAGFTNFSIIMDGMLRFTRDIPITSDSLTRDIADYCDMDGETAEKLKIQHGLSGITESQLVDIDKTIDNTNDALRVSQAMNFKMEKLVSNIDHTVKFYVHQLSDTSSPSLDKLILSGGGALIKGLDSFLAGRFDVPVEIANPFKKINIDDSKFDRAYLEKLAPRFTLSVGLALRKDSFDA